MNDKDTTTIKNYAEQIINICNTETKNINTGQKFRLPDDIPDDVREDLENDPKAMEHWCKENSHRLIPV